MKYIYFSRHAALIANQTLSAIKVNYTSLDSSLTSTRGILVIRRVNKVRLPIYSSYLIYIYRALLPVSRGIRNLKIIKVGLSMSNRFECLHIVI
jgi:hypothetical protein